MCITIPNIDHDCSPNLGGMISQVLVAHESDIESIPAIEATSIALNGDIVMKAGKSFASIAITGDSQLKSDGQGTVNAQSQKTTLTFTINKMTSAKGWVATQLQNARLVVIAKDSNGQYWVIGDKDRPAMWKSSADSGANAAAGTAYKIEVTHESFNGPLVYTGGMPPTD